MFHKISVEKASTFNNIVQNPDALIERQLNKQKEIERKTNMNLLKGIFDTVQFLSRQSLALRGHRDSGIFLK